MKTSKKILFGLFLFLLVAMPILTILTRPVMAAPITNTQLQNNPWYVNTVSGNPQYPTSASFTFQGDSFSFSDRDTNDTIRNLKYSNASDLFICDQTDAAREMGITITGERQAVPSGGYFWPATLRAYHSNDTDEACEGGNNQRFTYIEANIALLYQVPNQPPPPPPGGTNPPGEQPQTCESESSTALEWIMCPVFKIAVDFTDTVYSAFLGQLCFRTEASSNPNAECENQVDVAAVKPVWNAMKNLSTGLLVIIMLLMVIAQAMGRGPFA